MSGLNIDGWLKTSKPTKKGKKKSDIVVYPVLVTIAEMCTDDYWKQILIDCAMDNCPKPFYISNNCIMFKKIKKQESIEISFDEKEQDVWLKYVEFLKKHSTMRSNDDMSRVASKNKIVPSKSGER